MILILTDKNDAHANWVIDILKSRGLAFFRLDLDVHSLLETVVKYLDGNWEVRQNGSSLILDKIKSVWARRIFVELLLEEQNDHSPDFKIWKGEWNKALLGIYSRIRHLPWLNPWRNAYQAENKYLQMDVAKKVGFLVPPTIVSNEKSALISFAEENKKVALKLMQQDTYKQQNGEYFGMYVNVLDSAKLETFGSIEENPVVLQKYIEKAFEVRYTVVGKKHFACQIQSQESKIANTDWRRYDLANTPHSKLEIPHEIEEKVNLFMNSLQIEYGALDFIVTNENDWYFLEVNSMGQFLWIENLSGLAISDAIVDWLSTT